LSKIFNLQFSIFNQFTMTQLSNNKYDLEERTAKFGEGIILLCRGIKQDTITKPIISQLIRSATSIGANYMEANGASSRKEHWLRMLAGCVPDAKDKIRKLWQECQELTLIFQKIASSARNRV